MFTSIFAAYYTKSLFICGRFSHPRFFRIEISFRKRQRLPPAKTRARTDILADEITVRTKDVPHWNRWGLILGESRPIGCGKAASALPQGRGRPCHIVFRPLPGDPAKSLLFLLPFVAKKDEGKINGCFRLSNRSMRTPRRGVPRRANRNDTTWGSTTVRCGRLGEASLMGTIVKGQSRAILPVRFPRCLVSSVHPCLSADAARHQKVSCVFLLFAIRSLRRACIV